MDSISSSPNVSGKLLMDRMFLHIIDMFEGLCLGRITVRSEKYGPSERARASDNGCYESRLGIKAFKRG